MVQSQWADSKELGAALGLNAQKSLFAGAPWLLMA
jgi:hypothetical protein